jgi:hypothetical protein
MDKLTSTYDRVTQDKTGADVTLVETFRYLNESGHLAMVESCKAHANIPYVMRIKMPFQCDPHFLDIGSKENVPKLPGFGCINVKHPYYDFAEDDAARDEITKTIGAYKMAWFIAVEKGGTSKGMKMVQYGSSGGTTPTRQGQTIFNSAYFVPAAFGSGHGKKRRTAPPGNP